MLSRRNQFDCRVVANDVLCREHYRLTLACMSSPPTEPGQFFQVQCAAAVDADTPSDREIEWPPVEEFESSVTNSTTATLRRPFSIAARREIDGVTQFEVIGREVGVGTRWLARRRPGDVVNVLGPLGNAFVLPPANGIALLVGGGVGIPPMLYLAEKIGRTRNPDGSPALRGVAFCGATTRDLLPLTITDYAKPSGGGSGPVPLYNVDEFARHSVAALITTDDGSLGSRGYTTDALSAYLAAYVTPDVAPRVVIYTCGPEIMMKKVAALAQAHGVACQVAVERAMACGMGTCQSCCIRVKRPESPYRTPDGDGFVWKLACTDGTVFDSKTLLW